MIGGTAFPNAGAAAAAEKGAALFWFNLHADGERDLMTYHGGCLTSYGLKWGMCSKVAELASNDAWSVLNKWIREGPQWRARPCGLRPGEEVENAHFV